MLFPHQWSGFYHEGRFTLFTHTMSSSQQEKQDKPGNQVGPAGLLLRASIPVVILILAVGGFFLLAKKMDKEKPPPPKKQVLRTRIVELELRDYPVSLKTHGNVQPHIEITIQPQVSGLITELSPSFEDGAFFSQGDVLIRLDAADYETALQSAEARLLGAKASLELAKANHARNEEVVKENLIPQTEADLSAANLKQAEADVQSADAQVARAKRDLERTGILAPFDGRVRQRLVGLGQLVGAGTPLGSIFAVDYAEVRLPISSRELPFVDLPSLLEDPPVPVVLHDALDMYSGKTWQARIIRTEGALNEDSLELFAIARVDDPFARLSGDTPLRIGQPVTAVIQGRVLKDVYALPRVAVHELDQINLVNAADLTLFRKTIEKLWSDEEHIVVQDTSIENGAWLATTHLVYAPDGTKVEIIPDVNDTTMPVTEPNENEKAGTNTQKNSSNSDGKS